MARQAPFTEYEAVLLLDAYLRTVSGDASRRDAVKDCSDALRRMAINALLWDWQVYLTQFPQGFLGERSCGCHK